MSDAVIMGIVTAITTVALALISAMRFRRGDNVTDDGVRREASLTPGNPRQEP